MKSPHDESFEKKSPVNIAFEKGRSEMENVKRFSLISHPKRNSPIENIIVSPSKMNSSTKKPLSQVQLEIPTTLPEVRCSVLRQFDPLFEKFDEKEENQKKTISNSSNTKSGCHEKEITAIESPSGDDLSGKQIQHENTIANSCVTNILDSVGNETFKPTSSIDDWSRLSTIHEMSTEDLTETSSALTISGTDCVKICENEMYVDLIGIDTILPNLYGQSSKKNVEETSSCSSCMSYTTSCSTLEEIASVPPPPAPCHDDPVRLQHYLHEELSLENELCIKMLKMAHERNKNTKSLKENYEKHMEQKANQLKDALISHVQMKTLLAMGEDAFSNLHSKYNKAKAVIDDYHKNEYEIKKITEENDVASKMCKEKYELLEGHGKIKLAEFKVGAMEESKTFKKEMRMMQVAMKHLHIKISSLEQQLSQKSIECVKLSKLYVEMIVE